jgi:hypothetical protein
MAKPTLPSETDHLEPDLAAAGARYSASRLADGARAILGYAKADEASLKPFGFDAAWRAALSAKVTEVGKAKSQRVSTASAARPTGVAAAKAVDDARAWLNIARAVLAALPASLGNGAPTPPAHAERTTHLAEAIRSLVTFFAAHKGTSAFGATPAFVKQGTSVAQSLEDVRAQHKLELSNVGPEVFRLHVVEGIVALELGRLSAVAHRVLPASRAKLYAITGLRPKGGGKRAGKAKGTPVATAKG